MPRRITVVNGTSYVLSPDAQPPLGSRLWVLVHARAIDELTGQPVASVITLESDAIFTSPRVAGDGLVGLIGVPHQAFPPLAAQNYTIHLTVRAAGYLWRRAAVAVGHDQRTLVAPAPALHDAVMTLNDTARLSIGETLLVGPAGPHLDIVQIRALGPGAQQVTLTTGLVHGHAIGEPVVPVVPDDFAPTDLGDLAMHREPVVMLGRTMQASGSATTPLAGARVTVTGIWRRLPPSTVVVPPAAPNLVSLHTPLRANRIAGTDVLRRRNLSLVAGGDKQLLDDIPAGERLMRLSNRQNLGPGNVLLIDADDPDRAEYVTINTIAGSSTPTEPARITLHYPFAYAHRRDTRVQRVMPQPQGAVRQFVVHALAGDTTIFLSSLTGLATGNQVWMTDGMRPDEYHRIRRYVALSDADGYYRLPPLSRVAQLELRAEHGALTPIHLEFRPDYSLRENRMDFVFR
jgi:hypothetical protein